MKVQVEVECCDKCPHAAISKVYTPDSWEDVREIKCKQTDKVVYKYLDWYDRSPIPDECPFK